MALATEIATVRLNANEPTTDRFSDLQIGDIIDSYDSDLHAASAQVWRLKAGKYADLADVQEGSSRRSLGDLHEQAIRMASNYDVLSASAGAVGGRRPGRTRPIVRP